MSCKKLKNCLKLGFGFFHLAPAKMNSTYVKTFAKPLFTSWVLINVLQIVNCNLVFLIPENCVV